jgi:hypothetical protein
MRQVRLWFEDFSIAFFFRTVTMEMSGKCWWLMTTVWLFIHSHNFNNGGS